MSNQIGQWVRIQMETVNEESWRLTRCSRTKWATGVNGWLFVGDPDPAILGMMAFDRILRTP